MNIELTYLNSWWNHSLENQACIHSCVILLHWCK